MKKYLAIQYNKNPARWMVSFNLYRIKNNDLIPIQHEQEFTRASTRGWESEVLTALCDAWEYPKKCRDDYYHEHQDKIKINYH